MLKVFSFIYLTSVSANLGVEYHISQFDLVIHSDQEAHIEFWYARDLMPLLGYERWENFDKAIGRAIESCKTSGIEVSDHFREITKMMTAGKGAQRAVKDYVLTRSVLKQIFV